MNSSVMRLHVRSTVVLTAVFCVFTFAGAHGQAGGESGSSQKTFTAAQKLYEDGNWEAALQEFSRFVTTYRFSEAVSEAVFYQGWCLYNLRKFKDAAQTFERITKNFPSFELLPEVILKQAESLRELNEFQRALTLYRVFQEKYPGHELIAQAKLGEAWMLYKQKNLGAAKSVAQEVRNRYGNNSVINLDVLFLLGQIFGEERDFSSASDVYNEIAKEKSNIHASKGLFMAGEAMYDAKRYEEAIPFYERVQSKSALLKNVQAEMDELRSKVPKLIAAGQSHLFIQSQIDSLRQFMAELRRKDDLRPTSLFRIGNCYQALEKPEEASVVYRQLLRSFPGNSLEEKTQFCLVQSLTQRKQGEKAVIEAGHFAKRYPSSSFGSDAMLLQAETLFEAGKFDEAEAHYKKFRSKSKDAASVEMANFRIASCSYGLKDFAKSRNAFADFLEKYPKSRFKSDALFRLGRSYFELAQEAKNDNIYRTNLEDAVKFYEQIRTEDPGTELLPEVTLQLGYMYNFLGSGDAGNYEKSITLFNEFLDRWPKHRFAPEAMYWVGRGQIAMQQYDEAIKSYQGIEEKYPRSEIAPSAAFEVGSIYAARNQPDEMVAALRSYTKRFPKHAQVGEAINSIGSVLEKQRKFEQAIAEYRSLIDQSANEQTTLTTDLRTATIAAQIRVATLLQHLDTLATAMADCQNFVSVFSNEAEMVQPIIIFMAAQYHRAKDYEAAFTTFDQMMTKHSGSPAVRIAAATATLELALMKEDTVRGRQMVDKLLADPEADRLPANTDVSIGNALINAGQHLQAKKVFEKVMAKFPDDQKNYTQALVGRGLASLGLNELDSAEASFRKLQTIAPNSYARYKGELGLAKIYERRGKMEDAISLYANVVANTRTDISAQAASRLGAIYLARKDYKTALTYYLRVALVTSGPLGEEASLQVAVCHITLGDFESARDAYQMFVRRFPNSTSIELARRKLIELANVKPQTEG